jgi:hypothetical protein
VISLFSSHSPIARQTRRQTALGQSYPLSSLRCNNFLQSLDALSSSRSTTFTSARPPCLPRPLVLRPPRTAAGNGPVLIRARSKTLNRRVERRCALLPRATRSMGAHRRMGIADGVCMYERPPGSSGLTFLWFVCLSIILCLSARGLLCLDRSTTLYFLTESFLRS